MKTFKVSLILFMALTTVSISAQVNDINKPTQTNNVQEQQQVNDFLGITEGGVLTRQTLESLNIPQLKVENNILHLELEGELYKIPLDRNSSEIAFVSSFKLNGHVLELGLTDNQVFNVDLKELLGNRKALTGAFATASNVTSNSPGDPATDDLVFGSTQLDDNGMVNNQLRLLFDKSKGAFRAGHAQGTEFDDANRGIRSGAFGLNNIASGTNSFSAGKSNTASNDAAVAFGSNNIASGKKTFISGANNTASGNNSYVLGSNSMSTEKGSGSLGDNNQTSGANATSIGVGLKAESAGQLSTGVYNTAALASNPTDPTVDTDRLFVIGNGDSDASRSDALLMLKNANTTLNGTLTLREGGTGNAYTLPGNDGSMNQVMQTNGSGTASWATLSVDDADANPTNEIQTISAGGTTSPTINLSDMGGTITFAAGTNVTLSRSGNTITINSAGGGGGGGCTAYGDGNAGNLTLAANTNFATTPPANGNYNFQDLTINAGVTLTVASGTIIKCSGNFVNNGTITVLEGIPEARWAGHLDDGFPDTKGLTKDRRRPLDPESLRALNFLGPLGGSNGADGGNTGITARGGSGGGTLTIICGGTLTNNGTINAVGGNANDEDAASTISGSAGGGGGFLLLVAEGNITGGTINVNGGEGGNSGGSDDDHAGGGGGGGLIHFVSPNANAVAGTLNVAGGMPGSPGQANPLGSSGGHGGAGAGEGGMGGEDSGGVITVFPQAGSAGLVLRTQMTSICGFFN